LDTVPSQYVYQTIEPLSCIVVGTIESAVVGLTTVVCPIIKKDGWDTLKKHITHLDKYLVVIFL
jgi:hypothetical protein